MVDTITDATPYLTSLVDVFRSELLVAKDKLVSELDYALTYSQTKLDSAVKAVDTYLTNNPIVNVGYDNKLVVALSRVKTGANLVSSNKFNEASVAFSTMMSNAQQDYTVASDAAVEHFNTGINSAKFDDPGIQTKIDTASASLAQISADINDGIIATETTEAVPGVSSILDDYQSKFVIASNTSKGLVESHVQSFIVDRPAVRFTGKYKAPDNIVFNSTNDWSFELGNIGNKPWSGSVTLHLKDQYKKSVYSSPLRLKDPLKSGESRTFTVSIYLPRTVKTKKGIMMNMGKTLSASVIFK